MADFSRFHSRLPAEKRSVPVFVILYGEANIDEMSGDKVFDALSGDLCAAFEIRGCQ